MRQGLVADREQLVDDRFPGQRIGNPVGPYESRLHSVIDMIGLPENGIESAQQRRDLFVHVLGLIDDQARAHLAGHHRDRSIPANGVPCLSSDPALDQHDQFVEISSSQRRVEVSGEIFGGRVDGGDHESLVTKQRCQVELCENPAQAGPDRHALQRRGHSQGVDVDARIFKGPAITHDTDSCLLGDHRQHVAKRGLAEFDIIVMFGKRGDDGFNSVAVGTQTDRPIVVPEVGHHRLRMAGEDADQRRGRRSVGSPTGLAICREHGEQHAAYTAENVDQPGSNGHGSLVWE